MPSDTTGTVRARATRLTLLWTLLTVATAGFALLVAGYSVGPATLVPLGLTLLSGGGLGFLMVQFWNAGLALLPPRTPKAPAPPARVVDFTYEEVLPAQAPGLPELEAATKANHEPELIEFELVPQPQAPTRLAVPPAFAAPPPAAPAVKRKETVTITSTGSVTRVPASERTDQIVSGLPILSSIFSRHAPEATQVSGERPGKSRGQCSNCGTFLWAPTQRPIRLRCPKCGHVRTLTG